MKIIFNLLIALILSIPMVANALTFPLPAPGDDVVGQNTITAVAPGENLSDIALRTGFGYYELIEANPNINPRELKPGTQLNIPSQFILPAGTREGIVINLAEMRLYYYLPNRKEVITFPIAIGREGWKTPLAEAKVVAKVKDPVWRVPPSIKAESARAGVKLPDVVPAGPKNPLGKYAVRLSLPGIMLHGTLSPRTIGTRGSHGCMRMYAADIESLYNLVPMGTPVYIINQPYKIGWLAGKAYLEAHEPLQDQASRPLVLQAMLAKAADQSMQIDWQLTQKELIEQDGIPQIISSN